MEVSRRAQSIKASSTLAISAKAAELKAQGKDMVTFGVGEPDFDTPAHIREAAKKAIDEGKTRYTPAAGTPALRKAVCDKLKKDNGLDYEPAQVVISNGAKHSLMNAFMAILNEGDEVIIPAPFWLSYAEMVKIAGGVPVVVHTKKENNFMLTKEELEGAYTAKTKALILTSPSNPTGMISSLEDLQMVADFAVKHDIFVISDEIYEKLIYDEGKKHISIASLGKEIYDRTIVINGVSKSYAMTGWRIGFAAAPLEVAKLMSSLQSHMASNPNSIAQKAALEAPRGPQDAVTAMREEFDQRRKYMYERVSQMPLVDALEPEGAFYTFVDFTDVLEKSYKGVRIGTASRVAEILIEDYKVAVVPCQDYGFDNFVRLSYAISMENIKKGLDRIEEFVSSL